MCSILYECIYLVILCIYFFADFGSQDCYDIPRSFPTEKSCSFDFNESFNSYFVSVHSNSLCLFKDTFLRSDFDCFCCCYERRTFSNVHREKNFSASTKVPTFLSCSYNTLYSLQFVNWIYLWICVFAFVSLSVCICNCWDWSDPYCGGGIGPNVVEKAINMYDSFLFYFIAAYYILSKETPDALQPFLKECVYRWLPSVLSEMKVEYHYCSRVAWV